ncbi:MAG: nicotinate phosphoribosyltransferase [Myxococcota bacterium]
MSRLEHIYRTSLALLTDLYQLTMAYGYWKAGMAGREAVFHLFFRSCPFDGGYALSCGLDDVVGYLERYRFTDEDLDYLRGIPGDDGAPVFDDGFLAWLADLRLEVDVDAVPEGTPMFAHEPMIRVRGPLAQAQLLETPLLTLTNFPTLIATKASRICLATGGGAVVDFGLRRAQGTDGGLTAARAAYVGGCAGTSNVLAGRHYGIPVKGTHAHSWIMSFDEERDAFMTYARVMPNNSIFLVDTYDTLEGVRRAVEAGRWLREQGHEMVGVRLDSGDLGELARGARRILDEAGFEDAAVVASGDLDEHRIDDLVRGGAPIDLWGVGTRLVTGWEEPALGGVYKLGAIRGEDGTWHHRLKTSDDPAKLTNPGVQRLRRYRDADGVARLDVIHEEGERLEPGTEVTRIDPGGGKAVIPDDAVPEEMLVPILRSGRLTMTSRPSLHAVRDGAAEALGGLPEAVRRLECPEPFPVALSPVLQRRKDRLMEAHRRTE